MLNEDITERIQNRTWKHIRVSLSSDIMNTNIASVHKAFPLTNDMSVSVQMLKR